MQGLGGTAVNPTRLVIDVRLGDNANMQAETFLWHDYETFGADPRRDRPCQFAAIRTDEALNPIGEPVVWYCQPASDVLPNPDACLITGITPQTARDKGMPEYRFASRVDALMSEPGTCSVGYNNFRFDDEVTRFLFWRNFIDPYAREFRNGNSRFDLIDVLRLCCALRPDGIEWHYDEAGTPRFRLEDLARANGMSTEHAHDALADVSNTLGMAKRLRRHNPKLWAWALSLRARHRVERLVDSGDMLLHASSRFPASDFCIAPVLPLFRHPSIKSQWLVWNLRDDPDNFEPLDVELLSDLAWTASADLPEGMKRLPVKWIRTNRSPMLAPIPVLDAAAAERTGIDIDTAERHARALKGAPGFIERLQRVYAEPRAGAALDAETALYEGFIADGDRRALAQIRSQPPDAAAARLKQPGAGFADERLEELLLHYVARHAPEALDAGHRGEWERYRLRKLVDDPELGTIRVDEYRRRIDQLRAERPDANRLLDRLEEWLASLGIDRTTGRELN